MTDLKALIARARKQSVAIYAGADKCVADDVAPTLREMADALDRLAAQEPVAWMMQTGHGTMLREGRNNPQPDVMWNGKPAWVPLYAAPAAPQEAKDAERYRWLAENAVIETDKWRHDGRDPASTKLPLDNAIDAAMAREKP